MLRHPAVLTSPTPSPLRRSAPFHSGVIQRRSLLWTLTVTLLLGSSKIQLRRKMVRCCKTFKDNSADTARSRHPAYDCDHQSAHEGLSHAIYHPTNGKAEASKLPELEDSVRKGRL